MQVVPHDRRWPSAATPSDPMLLDDADVGCALGVEAALPFLMPADAGTVGEPPHMPQRSSPR
jgi:hypothetical protein